MYGRRRMTSPADDGINQQGKHFLQSETSIGGSFSLSPTDCWLNLQAGDPPFRMLF